MDDTEVAEYRRNITSMIFDIMNLYNMIQGKSRLPDTDRNKLNYNVLYTPKPQLPALYDKKQKELKFLQNLCHIKCDIEHCCICHDNKRSLYVAKECGHAPFCETCCTKLKKCPYCTEKTKFMKLSIIGFLSNPEMIDRNPIPITTCPSCAENPAETLFLTPCGHTGICSSCVKDGKCPICKSDIRRIQTLFVS